MNEYYPQRDELWVIELKESDTPAEVKSFN